jgi:hypothetical protein
MGLPTRVRSRVSPATLASVLGAACVGLTALVAIFSGFRHSTSGEFPARAETILERFAAGPVGAEAYEDLFRYFLTGFLSYRQPQGALASYPGLPSNHGERVDAMEGFTRFAPMAAAWLHSGRSSQVDLADGRTLDLVEILRRGLTVGTDAGSAEYWGEVGHYDQRIVEAADVALTIWLTRDILWKRLKQSEQEQIERWLALAATRNVPDNNWHLFPTFVSLVLHELGVSVDLAPARQHYERLKTFYRGEGWFSDGPGNVYDYYNAWAIHYHLYWISRVSPDWDAAFIASARREFLKSYKHLVGRSGVPMRGRSVCYRMATPAPLVFDYASGSGATKPGEARRALDLTWAYFIRRGAVREGSVTQGYCGPDERLLDNYSGPASCLWSLRSLIPAFAIPARDRFWAGRPDSLPIDRTSYRLRVNPVGWTIAGDARTGITSLTADDSLPDSLIQLRSTGGWAAFKARVSGRPNRARNKMAKYQAGTYYSEPPFCGCADRAEH